MVAAPKIREYKPTRFKLVARTRNGFDIEVRVEGNAAREGKMETLGKLQMTPDQWRALNVMLSFAEVKVGHALRSTIEVDADDFVAQVL
jgi:hypothetical protein